MMPQVMWAQSLPWTPHQHPGRTTGTMSPTGTFLTRGLASFTRFNTAHFFFFGLQDKLQKPLISQGSRGSHRIRGLEDIKKEHAWMIPILCWQLGKRRIALSQAEQPRQSLSVNNCHQKTSLFKTNQIPLLYFQPFSMTAKAYSKSAPNPAEMRCVQGLTVQPSRCYTAFFIEVSLCWEVHCQAPTQNTERRNKFVTWAYAKAEVTH